jgi:hypothetical protein
VTPNIPGSCPRAHRRPTPARLGTDDNNTEMEFYGVRESISMSHTREAIVLDRLLDPVTRSLTPEAARQLVSLRADDELQERLEVLADKCTEGRLTPEEHKEYEAYVGALQVISILQAKARKLLAVPAPR